MIVNSFKSGGKLLMNTIDHFIPTLVPALNQVQTILVVLVEVLVFEDHLILIWSFQLWKIIHVQLNTTSLYLPNEWVYITMPIISWYNFLFHFLYVGNPYLRTILSPAYDFWIQLNFSSIIPSKFMWAYTWTSLYLSASDHFLFVPILSFVLSFAWTIRSINSLYIMEIIIRSKTKLLLLSPLQNLQRTVFELNFLLPRNILPIYIFWKRELQLIFYIFVLENDTILSFLVYPFPLHSSP